jgi:hypothetical protein
MKPTKTLCKYAGGSTLYHLTTPESDYDERGVFMHTDPAYILGTKRYDEARTQNQDDDIVYKELSHFCGLLRKSNSEAMEVLFCDDSEFTQLEPEFKALRANAYSFVDSKNLFNCLRGYMKGELRLAIGERKGKLGGKRYAKLQEVGFSPKNFVQLLRLAKVGIEFFTNDRYVVDTRQFGDAYHQLLMAIKSTPENFNVDNLKSLVADYEAQLVDAFENREIDYKFDEDKCNEILLDIYRPMLA